MSPVLLQIAIIAVIRSLNLKLKCQELCLIPNPYQFWAAIMSYPRLMFIESRARGVDLAVQVPSPT